MSEVELFWSPDKEGRTFQEKRVKEVQDDWKATNPDKPAMNYRDAVIEASKRVEMAEQLRAERETAMQQEKEKPFRDFLRPMIEDDLSGKMVSQRDVEGARAAADALGLDYESIVKDEFAQAVQRIANTGAAKDTGLSKIEDLQVPEQPVDQRTQPIMAAFQKAGLKNVKLAVPPGEKLMKAGLPPDAFDGKPLPIATNEDEVNVLDRVVSKDDAFIVMAPDGNFEVVRGRAPTQSPTNSPSVPSGLELLGEAYGGRAAGQRTTPPAGGRSVEEVMEELERRRGG